MRPRALAACLFALLMSARSIHGQNFEASGNGGYGVVEDTRGTFWWRDVRLAIYVSPQGPI